MRKTDDRQQLFLKMADEYKGIIAKVCSVYATTTMPFADLYQEVMANLWAGIDTFRGESKQSTWIYRVALNTCINQHRHTSRHTVVAQSFDYGFDVADIPDNKEAEVRRLYRLIAQLGAIDRAIIMLWLDEKSYDEISTVTGLSKANVATRLFRAKQQLSNYAEKMDI
ncbi:MAG: RNA polymerase sigma factor [Odoribacter sp.]|nr:RNA polymerase sigma factor [Odoribacter sp.]